LILTYPLMVGIQIVSARLGRVTGYGLAGIMRRHYSPKLLYVLVSSLLIANTINIAADIGAMGEALSIVIGGPRHWYAAAFGLFCCVLQIFASYNHYVRVLKWLTLSLFAYVGVVFVVQIPWIEVAKSIALPALQFNAAYITTVVAILGTTISPYLFFWQASQEVEDLRATKGAKHLRDNPEQAPAHLRRIKWDTFFGMGVSNLIAFFIMLTTAATLQAHGLTHIETSAQAAQALRPIAGQFAFLLFGLGIIGTGLLAVPVLAGSSAFAVAEALRWRRGLDLPPISGTRFYGIIVASTVLAIALSFSRISPIKALFWSAVINGLISVPIMITMMKMAANPKIMGQFVISPRLKFLGWCATTVMAVAAVGMCVQIFLF